MPDEGYNGWSNYETWAMALWIDNDEASHTEARAFVVQECGYAEDNPSEYGLTVEQDATYNLARRLQEWQEESYEQAVQMLNDNIGGAFADLLGAAWSEIDWAEIARNYMSEVDA